MSLSIRWREGQYGTKIINLSSLIKGYVCWKTLKEDKDFVAYFMDKKLGSFDNEIEAKEAVEKEAALHARTVFARLEDKEVRVVGETG